MPDLQALLDQIDRLDQQATKGPWIIDSIESGEHALFVDEDNPGYGHLGAASSTVASFLLAKNADFIAHARESLPQLAKALRAVMELLDNEEEQHARTHGQVFNGDQTVPARISVNVLRLAIQNAMEADDA